MEQVTRNFQKNRYQCRSENNLVITTHIHMFCIRTFNLLLATIFFWIEVIQVMIFYIIIYALWLNNLRLVWLCVVAYNSLLMSWLTQKFIGMGMVHPPQGSLYYGGDPITMIMQPGRKLDRITAQQFRHGSDPGASEWPSTISDWLF